MAVLWGRRWTREELLARVGRLEQVAGIRLVEGGDGAERGVRMLRCSTGSGFDFEILVDRGFDVAGAWIGGRPLAWSSPVGLVGPWYCEPEGIGWFRGFPGGLVSTCGLDHTLLGGPDDATVFDYPHRVTEMYGLHGRYTGLPARLAGYGVTWDGDECVLWAEGEVLQAALFGEQLLLRRRVEADGLVGAAVVNRALELGVFQRYDPAVLPRHITWRQLGTVAYVVAMEPSTNRDAGRFDARDRGELIQLAPGQARRYRLEIGALVGHDAIDAFASQAELKEVPDGKR